MTPERIEAMWVGGFGIFFFIILMICRNTSTAEKYGEE